ncbi:MAG: restriction endonuclease, SacI family [Christensenellales bacterium]|jgi:hypothetical protein
MKKEDVRVTLYKALADAKKDVKKPKCRELIDYVLDNTHLTYKYVLVNALASKATDPSINALCLQKKSKLPGSYDARTICHKVLVQFEMTELGKALGGSNEPFLNIPARFTELSKTNAVRRGNDQSILNALCDGLPKITTATEAYAGLVYAIKKLLAIKEERAKITAFDYSSLNGDAAKLAIFIDRLLNENFEGEALTLSIAGLYELYMDSVADDYLVEVHPVNQSGASSKEVSDLDIYKDEELFIANELKDKAFTEQDIRHAADKVIAAGKRHMHFIVGRHGGCNNDEIRQCVSEYLSKGFIINVVPVDFFVLTLVGLIGGDIDIDHFMKFVLETAIETKFKEETVAFIRQIANEQFND